MENLNVDLNSYTTITAFLNAYVTAKRKQDKKWSIGKWAKELGLKSTTSISLVINGKRNCGRRIGEALQNYFQFSESDRKHFEFLVAKSKYPDPSNLSSLLELEIVTKSKNRKTIVLNESQMREIGHWYFFALRQLARIAPLVREEIWLKQRLFLTDENINLTAAVDKLAELGFLTQTEGQFVATDIILSTEQNIESESIKIFHEEMAAIATDAIRKYAVSERSFQGCTLRMNSQDLGVAKKMIEKFVVDFECVADASDGESIYQMNIQLFPLAGSCAKNS